MRNRLWRAGLMALALTTWLAGSGCRKTEPPVAGSPAPGMAPTPGGTPAPSPSVERRDPPVSTSLTLAAGTTLAGTLQNTVATDKSRVGDPVTMRTTGPVMVGGRTAIPAGSTVNGSVTHVRSAGRFKGAAELTVRFTELVLPNGRRQAADFDAIRRVKKGSGKETAAEIGGGAAAGGILGGILGGKGGAVKGGAIGGAVGTGVAAATKGNQIVMPAGQPLQLQLAAPLTITVAPVS